MIPPEDDPDIVACGVTRTTDSRHRAIGHRHPVVDGLLFTDDHKYQLKIHNYILVLMRFEFEIVFYQCTAWFVFRGVISGCVACQVQAASARFGSGDFRLYLTSSDPDAGDVGGWESENCETLPWCRQ